MKYSYWCRNGRQWQTSLVNISWSLKNKKERRKLSWHLKKAVDIAAMWNTKGVTVDAEFNIKHVQEWSRSQSIPLRKPRLALLGLWEGVWDCTVCFYIFFSLPLAVSFSGTLATTKKAQLDSTSGMPLLGQPSFCLKLTSSLVLFFSFHNPRWLNCKKNCLHPAVCLLCSLYSSLYVLDAVLPFSLVIPLY